MTDFNDTKNVPNTGTDLCQDTPTDNTPKIASQANSTSGTGNFETDLANSKAFEKAILDSIGATQTVGKCSWDGVAPSGIRIEIKKDEISYTGNFIFEFKSGESEGDLIKSAKAGVELLIIGKPCDNTAYFICLQSLYNAIKNHIRDGHTFPIYKKPQTNEQGSSWWNYFYLVPMGFVWLNGFLDSAAMHTHGLIIEKNAGFLKTRLLKNYNIKL